jgi:3-deoxy-manno-octulosonate cytidylyltransferase (CMP-KDO synthetase)
LASDRKNIIGIIPARYDSTRLPGKPLMDIGGKMLIRRVYEQSLKSKLLSEVIIATDDRRIFDAVMGFGGMAVMTSKRHKTGTDRILEAIQGFKCDIVVNIQGDEPFVDAKDIDDAIKPLLNDKTLNVSTLGVRMNDGKEVKDPHSVKVVFDKNNDALYFSRNVIPYSEKPDVKKDRYYKHIGLYVYRKKFLEEFGRTRQSELEKIEKLEQLRILEMGEKIRVVITKSDSFGVDTKADLLKARKLVKNG